MYRAILICSIIISPWIVQGMTGDSQTPQPEPHPGQRLLSASLAMYQKVSHALPILNCQFEPSCSHYMLQAIQQYGPARGMVIGTDRVLRCNPFAYYYHLRDHPREFHSDGRLLDPVPDNVNLPKIKQVYLIDLIPGSRRMRSGRLGDGLISIAAVTSCGLTAARFYQTGSLFGTGIFGMLTTLFWIGDIRYATPTVPPSSAVQNFEPQR